MEPQDAYPGWAVDGGHLRASDADRERVIDVLKAAFVQDRLTKGELARRAGQALQSKTYADLAGATAGIPPAPAATPPPRQAASPVAASPVAASPVGARPVNWKVIAWVVGVIVVTPALGVAFFATYYGSFYILLLLGFVASGLIGSPGVGRRRSVF
jgi:Domain of unknown function (DUF1707)